MSERLQSGWFYIAATYALLHNSDKTFSSLEEAYKQHDWNWGFLKVRPEFDSLHSDPRFQALVRRIGIPSS